MKRSIVHMDLDTFFVSCERLRDSKLEGIPLIIGGKNGRGVVASCSYEARYFGVRSAMPMRHALRLCPQAKVIKGDMDLYSRKSREVTEIVEEKAPVMEKASIDEFYVDMTGMERFFGSYNWTREMIQKIRSETGLPMSFGLSVNKSVAKIATGEGKPLGKLDIPQDDVQGFLNPLSIRKIPSVGNVTYEELSRIGIRLIEHIVQTPQDFMESMFGKNGSVIWKRARGIDNSPVVQYSERKSISSERTFQRDTTDINNLLSIMVQMVEKLAFQLRKESRMASVITVKVRYSNFDTETMQQRIPYTANDDVLIKVMKELFHKLYQRRMLVRLIGVKLSGFIRGSQQMNLFEDREEMVNLYQAIDRMKRRFGSEAVFRGIGA